MNRKFIALFMAFILMTSLFSAPLPAFAAPDENLHPLGCIIEPREEISSIAQMPLMATAALPAIVDHSDKFPRPGNQSWGFWGQGSCVAWATTYALKSFQDGNRLGWDVSIPEGQFSPAYVYNQINGGEDTGSRISDAMRLLVAQGCCTLKDMPYDVFDWTTQPTDAQKKAASKYKNLDYGSISTDKLNQMKARIHNGDGVVLGFPVYPDFDNLNESNPIYDDFSGMPRGNHAICLTGYDDSKAAFKFINSWGTSWGLSGFGYISYSFLLQLSEYPLQIFVMNSKIGTPEINTPPMLSSGYSHTLALDSDGTIWSWGDSQFGALGHETKFSRNTPERVKNINKIVGVSAGADHSLALKNDDTVWAWGSNEHGKLGDGTYVDRSAPVQVKNLTNVIAVSGGWWHSLALKSNGTVWAWGNNSDGQLGDGTSTRRSTPVQVKGLTNVIDIAAGATHSVAVKSDGTVWAWGNNEHGQLGNGIYTNGVYISGSKPVRVKNLTGVIAVAAGDAFSAALRRDGTVWTWGTNGYGQLGDGSRRSRNIPVQVKNLNNIIAISEGDFNTVALKSDGTVWTWGSNEFGQLGDGTLKNRNIPVQVKSMTNVVGVSTGKYHMVALRSDTTIWSWGDNSFGGLGNADYDSRLETTPVQVVDCINLGFLTLGQSPLKPPSVTGVKLNKNALTLKVGATGELLPTVSPSNAANKIVGFSSSSSAVAVVDSLGKITAKKVGTAVITAKTLDGGKTAKCTVTVTLPPTVSVTGVSIPGALKNIIVGNTATLKATVSPSNATNKSVAWSSSNSKIVRVDQSGKVTAVGAGKVTIKATAKDGSKKSASVSITVHQYVTMQIGKTAAIQNGKKTSIDSAGTKPFILSGKTMLPLRFVGEKMGGTVKYISDNKPITMSYGGTKVEFLLNDKKMKVITGSGSKTIILEVPAQKIKGKTYIPLRAISQALGFDVYYEAGSEYIVVNNPKMTAAIKTARIAEAKKYIK